MSSRVDEGSFAHAVKPEDVDSWSVEDVKDWAEEHYGAKVAEKFQGILFEHIYAHVKQLYLPIAVYLGLLSLSV